MKVLNSLLKRAKEKGCIYKFKASEMGGIGIELSHLLFIDDNLLFSEASQYQILYLSWTFIWFEVLKAKD